MDEESVAELGLAVMKLNKDLCKWSNEKAHI